MICILVPSPVTNCKRREEVGRNHATIFQQAKKTQNEINCHVWNVKLRNGCFEICLCKCWQGLLTWNALHFGAQGTSSPRIYESGDTDGPSATTRVPRATLRDQTHKFNITQKDRKREWIGVSSSKGSNVSVTQTVHVSLFSPKNH